MIESKAELKAEEVYALTGKAAAWVKQDVTFDQELIRSGFINDELLHRQL